MPQHDYLIKFTAGGNLKAGDIVEPRYGQVFKVPRSPEAVVQNGVVMEDVLEGYMAVVRMTVDCDPRMPQYHQGVVGEVELKGKEDAETVQPDDDGGASGGSKPGK